MTKTRVLLALLAAAGLVCCAAEKLEDSEEIVDRSAPSCTEVCWEHGACSDNDRCVCVTPYECYMGSGLLSDGSRENFCCTIGSAEDCSRSAGCHFAGKCQRCVGPDYPYCASSCP